MIIDFIKIKKNDRFSQGQQNKIKLPEIWPTPEEFTLWEFNKKLEWLRNTRHLIAK